MSSAERFPCTQESATAQEVFDRALNHLRAQGCQSKNSDGGCVYWTDCLEEDCQNKRHELGLRCGIGIFIRPEEYRSWMEGNPIDILLLNDECPTRLHAELIEHIYHVNGKYQSLLLRIQSIHDHNIVVHWESEFQKLAKDFKLIYKAP